MFKVHLPLQKFFEGQTLFQNISCLRFIKPWALLGPKYYRFQNISCLRFIKHKNKKLGGEDNFKTFHV